MSNPGLMTMELARALREERERTAAQLHPPPPERARPARPGPRALTATALALAARRLDAERAWRALL